MAHKIARPADTAPERVRREIEAHRLAPPSGRLETIRTGHRRARRQTVHRRTDLAKMQVLARTVPMQARTPRTVRTPAQAAQRRIGPVALKHLLHTEPEALKLLLPTEAVGTFHPQAIVLV